MKFPQRRWHRDDEATNQPCDVRNDTGDAGTGPVFYNPTWVINRLSTNYSDRTNLPSDRTNLPGRSDNFDRQTGQICRNDRPRHEVRRGLADSNNTYTIHITIQVQRGPLRLVNKRPISPYHPGYLHRNTSPLLDKLFGFFSGLLIKRPEKKLPTVSDGVLYSMASRLPRKRLQAACLLTSGLCGGTWSSWKTGVIYVSKGNSTVTRFMSGSLSNGKAV
jgi:hypothetical protein